MFYVNEDCIQEVDKIESSDEKTSVILLKPVRLFIPNYDLFAAMEQAKERLAQKIKEQERENLREILEDLEEKVQKYKIELEELGE